MGERLSDLKGWWNEVQDFLPETPFSAGERDEIKEEALRRYRDKLDDVL